MKRVRTGIGDIFCVSLDKEKKKYFQYIANDILQLNSDVIRVFKRTYDLQEKPELSSIVNDDVNLFTHCIIKLGLKLELWEKIGKIEFSGKVDVLFRASNDYGSRPGEQILVSHKWRVWQIGYPDLDRVAKLSGEERNAEIGIVVSPFDVITRMRKGKFEFSYPGFE